MIRQNMKSMVLCESNLVTQNESSTKELKEDGENGDAKTEEKKLTNGKSVIENHGELDLFHNGGNTCSEQMSGRKVCESEKKSSSSIGELSNSLPKTCLVEKENAKCSENVADIVEHKDISFREEHCESTAVFVNEARDTETNCGEGDVKLKENSVKLTNVESNLPKEDFQETKLENKLETSSLNFNSGENESEITVELERRVSLEEENVENERKSKVKLEECADKSKDVKELVDNLEESHSVKGADLRENFDDEFIVEKENDENKENREEIEDILSDVDGNKENEKYVKSNEGDEFPDPDESTIEDSINDNSSRCEIQVGECQTITETGKDSIWVDADLKKPLENSIENSLSSEPEKSADESEPPPASNQKSETSGGNVKEEFSGGTEDSNMVAEVEENEIEDIHFEEEETESTKGDEVVNESKQDALMDVSEYSADKNFVDGKTENKSAVEDKVNLINCRKRQLLDTEEGVNKFKKKTKLAEDDERVITHLPSERKSSDSTEKSSCSEADVTDTPQIDTEKSAQKRPLPETKDSKKLKTSPSVEETKKLPRTRSQEKAALASSILPNLRGTLKSLTRSDLEELLVQKLCEVITERSNIGELRRKAQALEQDQEKWKEKVQSLTKQIREMEMVMKKYMTEVQKQTKDPNSPAVTPLRVTRSVGLQVSFYSSANKLTKSNPGQSNSPNSVQNLNSRNSKQTSSKPLPQLSVLSPTVRNKSTPTPPKQSGTHKKPAVSRSDYSGPQNRPVVPQSVLNNSRVTSNQVPGVRPNYKSMSGNQCPQQQIVQQQQQQQVIQSQNGSKVIDLTDDDDRQISSKNTTHGNSGKQTGPIRLVNHLSQPQVSQNNRFAYLLPTTSTTATGTSAAQSRQVIIATPTMSQPNRQLMCSMPPLLFKGGNLVQPGSQPQMLNQANRVIFPKALRHPAPLPQPPVNQINRPNLKLLPPRPALKISKVQTGIVLSWNMTLGPEYAPISSYQLYAYQESNSPPATSLWKKVGDVKALPLPMACTLTQFMSGHKYHFAVRAVDLHSRIGPFSFPGTIVLVK